MTRRWRPIAALTGSVLALCALPATSGAAASPLFTPVSGSPFSTGADGASAVAFSPSGRLLATTGGILGLAMSSVGPTGALTPAPGSPFGINEGAFSPAFSPDGRLLANASEGSIDVFSVAQSGALTPVSGSPFAADGAGNVAFSPSGRLLASADPDSSTISVFSVAQGGALTPVSGSPFAASAGETESVAFSPDGRLLASGSSGGFVSVLSVGHNGALTPVRGSPFATGGGAFSVAFNPNGRLLAAVNGGGDGSVAMLAVDRRGVLTPVNGSPFATGGGPGVPATSVAFSPCGGLLAAANFDGSLASGTTVTVFSVARHGALVQVAGSPFATGGTDVFSVAFSPTRHLLAAANAGSGTVAILRRSSGGGCRGKT